MSWKAAVTSSHWSRQGGRDLLLGGDDDRRVGRDEVEQRAEALDRQQLGHVGALAALLGLQRGDLGQLAMLDRELGGRRDLDRLGVPERALREGREPAHRVDLDVEQVDAHGALLGGREDVEQAAADGELAAVLDLLDALVAGRDELGGDLVEVEHVADAQPEGVRPQGGIGHLLRERRRGHDHHRGLGVLGVAVGGPSRVRRRPVGEQRVERGDAQADEVRRRREVGLVGDAARGVEAHRARRQPGPQVGGQVARGAIVADDDERRPVGGQRA